MDSTRTAYLPSIHTPNNIQPADPGADSTRTAYLPSIHTPKKPPTHWPRGGFSKDKIFALYTPNIKPPITYLTRAEFNKDEMHVQYSLEPPLDHYIRGGFIRDGIPVRYITKPTKTGPDSTRTRYLATAFSKVYSPKPPLTN